MTSMIDKIARAIMMAGHCGTQSGGEWNFCEVECLCFKEARAAVEAMREPDREMLNAAGRETGYEETCVVVWQAMINAILNEGG